MKQRHIILLAVLVLFCNSAYAWWALRSDRRDVVALWDHLDVATDTGTQLPSKSYWAITDHFKGVVARIILRRQILCWVAAVSAGVLIAVYVNDRWKTRPLSERQDASTHQKQN